MFMENKREIKGPKFKSYDGVASPIKLMNLAGPRRHMLAYDPYASDSSDSPSPLMKLLRSVDSATSGASSPSFVTPVKVEEDVIVMDGISVPKSNKGIAEVRMRLPLMSSNSINSSFGKSNSTLSSSLGSGGRRSGGENCKSYKNRLCHFWENSGVCQFGSDCQFAHGKEELRHSRPMGKIKKHEISKLNSNMEGSSSSPYGSKILRNSPVKAAEEAPTQMALPASPVPAKQLSEWTPQIDGIEVSLPYDLTVEKRPTKEDVDAYIEKVLRGTYTRRRLPVFVEICPDS